MLRKVILFSIFVFLAAGIWIYLVQSNSSTKDQISNRITASGPLLQIPSNRQIAARISPLEEKLHQEASLIGRIDNAPDNTEERLQEWAHSLTQNEIEDLKEAALNSQKPQDDRFLAVMLMAWSQKSEALENLKDIALSEIDPYLSPNRAGDFERILRMQAVDGIIDLPVEGRLIESTLQAVAARTGESSLADRANRALWAIRGQAQSPKAQDQVALKKLLLKSKPK